LKEKKTINEKYETTYAFEKEVDGTKWYDYSNNAQFAYAMNENNEFI